MRTYLFISETGNCYVASVEWVQSVWYVVESCQTIGVSAIGHISREEALSWALIFWARNYPNITPKIQGVYSREEYRDE